MMDDLVLRCFEVVPKVIDKQLITKALENPENYSTLEAPESFSSLEKNLKANLCTLPPLKIFEQTIVFTTYF